MEFCKWKTLYESSDEITGDFQLAHGRMPTIGEFSNYGMRMEADRCKLKGYHPTESVTIRRLVAEHSYHKNKKPFFNVYPGMAAALTTTSINIPCNQLQLPFKTFTVHFTPNTIISHRGFLCSIIVSQFSSEEVLIMAKTTSPHKRLNKFGTPVNHFTNFIIDLASDETFEQIIQNTEAEEQFQAGYEGASIGFDEQKELKLFNDAVTLAVGVSFLAISKDREHVQRVRIRVKSNELCSCGSGKKNKKCCNKKQNVGYAIGKDINLPSVSSAGVSIIKVGSGRELDFGHVRSGHMRWQPYKDPKTREWSRKLIFIHPTIVRPDLDLKPQLTPRVVRKSTKRKELDRRNPIPRTSSFWRENPRVYHRSGKRGITRFDPTKMKFGDYGPGFYFAKEHEGVQYAGHHLYTADVNITHPLDVENATPEEVEKLRRVMRIDEENILRDDPTPPAIQIFGLLQTLWDADLGYKPQSVIKVLEALGYDGIVVPSKGYWVAFDPDQIVLVE